MIIKRWYQLMKKILCFYDGSMDLFIVSDKLFFYSLLGPLQESEVASE